MNQAQMLQWMERSELADVRMRRARAMAWGTVATCAITVLVIGWVVW